MLLPRKQQKNPEEVIHFYQQVTCPISSTDFSVMMFRQMWFKRTRFSFFTVLLCAGLNSGLWAVPLSERPNIIFILIDDLRWDEMNYPFVRVPNIQRIAREGVQFTNAFVTTPLCSPSRASFLTGQYAHKHGITDNTDRTSGVTNSSHSYDYFTILAMRPVSLANGTWDSMTT